MKWSDLRYCQETGKVLWPDGDSAGYKDTHGYINIMVERKNYYAHRIAWLISYGRFPEHQIDHINGDRSDNRLSNLRESTNQQNSMNKAMRSCNKSGVQGVSWDKQNKKWVCRIKKGQKYMNVGRYTSLAKAAEAINAAKADYGYSPRHGSA